MQKKALVVADFVAVEGLDIYQRFSVGSEENDGNATWAVKGGGVVDGCAQSETLLIADNELSTRRAPKSLLLPEFSPASGWAQPAVKSNSKSKMICM